uniref:GH18 domain-containing protein n=1 Tax=Quercus lobata TaxID=97700 RepID=A0A7N2L108_QUELO
MASFNFVYFLSFVFSLFISTGCVIASHPVVKAGYYPSWALDNLPPSAINTSYFTHIIYSFLVPSNVTFKFNISSSEAKNLSNFATTLHHKNPPVKALYSIGGGGVDPDRFGRMASKALTRAPRHIAAKTQKPDLQRQPHAPPRATNGSWNSHTRRQRFSTPSSDHSHTRRQAGLVVHRSTWPENLVIIRALTRFHAPQLSSENHPRAASDSDFGSCSSYTRRHDGLLVHRSTEPEILGLNRAHTRLHAPPYFPASHPRAGFSVTRLPLAGNLLLTSSG